MRSTNTDKLPVQRVGRYAIYDEIATGGMAAVHLARLAGPLGFSRVVAAKRLHPHLLKDDDFRRMFIDEARLAARIRHPNVVPTLDVLVHEREVILVMEYIHGESLLVLDRRAKEQRAPIPLSVAAAVVVSALHGLHAAHEARDERGVCLEIVHRDVSPHNILAGADGAVRVLDFGVARAKQACTDTRPGTLKGKFSYMAPELLRGHPATRQADVFAAAVVLWELVCGRKLFGGANEQERMAKVLAGRCPRPSSVVSGLPPIVDRILERGLSPETAGRYGTALEMAVDLETHLPIASQRVMSEWVQGLAAQSLEERGELLQRIEVSRIESLPAQAGDGRFSLVVPREIGSLPADDAGRPVISADLSFGGVPQRRGRRLGMGIAAAALLGVAAAAGSYWSQRRGEPTAALALARELGAAPATAPEAPPDKGARSEPGAPERTAGAGAEDDGAEVASSLARARGSAHPPPPPRRARAVRHPPELLPTMRRPSCRTISERARRAGAKALLVTAALLPGLARAEPGAAAPADPSAFKAEFAAAQRLFKAGKFAEALPLFREVAAASRSPNARLYVGHCLQQLGNLVDAYRAFTDTVKEITEHPDDKYEPTREAAMAQLASLNVRVAKLVISLTELLPDAAVTLDGASVGEREIGAPIVIDPGAHHVAATARGAAPIQRDVSLDAGETKTITLSFKRLDEPRVPAAAAPPPRAPSTPTPPGGGGVRVAGFAVAGAGLAGFVTFAIAGLSAKSTFDRLQSECASRCADAGHLDDVEHGKSMTTLANVGLVAGVLGVAAGTTMIVVGGPGGRDAVLSVSVSGASARLSYAGHF